jgi:hypothetical protein
VVNLAIGSISTRASNCSSAPTGRQIEAHLADLGGSEFGEMANAVAACATFVLGTGSDDQRMLFLEKYSQR